MRRVDVGLSAGWRGSIREEIPSSKCSAFSDLMNVVAVKEDTDSLAIRMNCLLLRSTSIENDWPIWLGGAEVENSVTCLGMRFTDAHVWQLSAFSLIARSRSKAAKFLEKISFNW